MTKDGNSKKEEMKKFPGIHPDRMSKFTYDEPGQLKITLPQCYKCKYNVGALECTKYGRKPDIYTSNEKDCPKREQGAS